MNKQEKIKMIEEAEALFFAIENVENEEDRYANEYDLWLMTEKGYRIESAKRDSGVGMDRMFSYLYYLNKKDDWANRMSRKAFLVNR